MAWLFLPASQATAWNKIAFLEQPWKAMVERQKAIGDAPLILVPVAGCDCQYAGELGGGGAGAASWPASTTGRFSVQCIQWWIQTHCSSFVATIDSGGNPITDFTGDAAIEMWDWTKVQARILGGHAWTRKYPDGGGGIATAYGLFQTGDYFQHRLWNELGNVFNELIKTLQVGAWYNNSENNGKQGGAMHADWPTVKANTEAAYDADVRADETTVPLAFTEAGSGGPGYSTTMARFYNYGRITPVCGSITKAADWYIQTVKPNWVGVQAFDANGDQDIYGDPITDGNYALWLQTVGHGAGQITTGSAFGSLTRPVWCNAPPPDNIRGYVGGQPAVVWNFTGFVYR